MRAILPNAANEVIGLLQGHLDRLRDGDRRTLLPGPGRSTAATAGWCRCCMVATVWYIVLTSAAVGRPVLRRAPLRPGRRPRRTAHPAQRARRFDATCAPRRPSAATRRPRTWPEASDERRSDSRRTGVDGRRPGRAQELRRAGGAARASTSRSARGEVTVILGPSGSGKSTLLRTINHLEKVDRGLDQHRRRADRLPALRRQAPRAAGAGDPEAAHPHRLRLPELQPLPAPDRAGERRRGPRLRAAAARARRPSPPPNACSTASVSPTRRHAYPRQLSGGQQQRVAIARALALRTQGAPLRRAHLGARPGTGGRGPRRHQGLGRAPAPP